jgi:nucleotide-binding universal stress UspA family protein
MKTILCPTDFSKNAANAAEYACALGETFSSHVILFHAYESPAVFTSAEFTIIKDAKAIIRDDAQKKLKSLKQKLGKKYPQVTLETELAMGAGYDKVVSASLRNNTDAIVMGTTGNSKVERLLMGSTTSRVIQNAECAVLCIPGEARFSGIKKIVFATDMHEDNITSAMTIAAFAMNFGADIVFVFVDDKHLVHAEEDISKMTRKIRSRVKYPKISGFISKNTSITRGIEYFLKKYPADMLVMFAHHKHFPGTIFNQSITKMMSYQTHIPLLALKAAHKAEM